MLEDKNTDGDTEIQNEQLRRTVATSLPWFQKWQEFRDSVEADIKAFQEVLITWQIPIVAWVELPDGGYVGWGFRTKSRPMELLFKATATSAPQPLISSDLEVKVMVFPYLSELSFQLCTKIKLANLTHHELERYGKEVLGKPSPPQPAKGPPQKIIRYA